MPDAPVVEELEPRILLSAGVEGALLADWSHDADVLMPANLASDSLLLEAESPIAGVHKVRNELVFVDAATPDYATLVDQLLSDAGDDRNLTVIVIESGRDGIEQISQALIGYSNLDAVHIISHGSDGAVQLGTTWFDNASLEEYRGLIGTWGDALGSDADLLFYGCNFAASEDGRAFIADLAGLTGADIAASNDVTGHASLGGDWTLERQVGVVESRAVFNPAVEDRWVNTLDVSVDSASSGTDVNTDNITISHTTSGTNRLMLVAIATEPNGAESVDTITYNGDDLSLVGSYLNANTNVRVEIWSLVAPDTGTFNVVLNLTAQSKALSVGVVTFTGVDQAAPLSGFVAAEGDGTTASVAVASEAGDLVFGFAGVRKGMDATPGLGQTEHFDVEIGNIEGAGSVEDGAASVTTSWTLDVSDKWVASGVSINAAAQSLWMADEASMVVQEFGGAGFALENPTTVGSFTNTFDLGVAEPAATTNVNALHYVSATMSLSGVGINSITVNPGDIILSVDGGDTLGGVSVAEDDLVVFQPTTPGDYSTGTFTMLAAGIGAGKDITAFSLIQSDTLVPGSGTLAAGDLLFVAGSGGDMRRIVHYDASTGGTAFVLDGDVDAAIGFKPGANVITGIDLVEEDITIGGRSLTAGQILISITDDDVSVGNPSGNIGVNDEDIFVVTLVSAADFSASLLFDGSDVGFPGDVHALAIAGNASPPVSASSFQEGVGGYTGTEDTYLDESSPATSYGTVGSISIDLEASDGNPTTEHQGLIQFANLFGTGPGQIPWGATIVSATLTFEATDGAPGATISLHRMLQSWNEGDSWNSMTNGISTDDSEAMSSADSSILSPISGTQSFTGLAAAVQAWADGDPNHGWAIVDSTNEGWDLLSSETGTATLRPRLDVTWMAPTGSISGTISEDVNGDALLGDAVGVANVDVDLYLDDGDGVIDAGDIYQSSTTTDGAGYYEFLAVADGTYWVVVDSTTIAPDAGYNGGFNLGDVWAEQTYASVGAVSFDGSYNYLGGAGSFYGGMQGEVSDDASALTSAEHVTRAIVSGADVANVDSAFSFNVVTRTGDGDDDGGADRSVQGSLRQFIQNSNAIVGTQSSRFEISTSDSNYNGTGNGEYTIDIVAPGLPALTDTIILDGTTQPGYTGDPIIELDGTLAAGSSAGISLRANNSTVRGFIVHSFPDDGIEIDGQTGFGDNNTIQNNWVGIDATGAAAGNLDDGIIAAFGASGNQIGGTGANEHNVFAGNLGSGVVFRDAGSDNNIVEGNYIGVADDGVTVIANQEHGAMIFSGASGNRIGGTATDARNIISGNTNSGVLISGLGTDNNVVEGNYVGVGANGVTEIGNQSHGIRVNSGAIGTRIGGAAAGAGNVVSGNDANGIDIWDATTTGTLIYGNYVGTDHTGTVQVGNAWDGIHVGGGALNVTIGGALAGQGNLISGNLNDGIEFTQGGSGHVIQGNYIGTNAAGTAALGNARHGIVLYDGINNSTVGGAVAGARNVISANGDTGIVIDGNGGVTTINNSILGNYIGTDATGTVALGNSLGVSVFGGASGNAIGGAGAGDGNLISANNSGILIDDAGTDNNSIVGNLIGTDATGNAGLGNSAVGIAVTWQADGTVIGGSTAAERNVIADNGDGIWLFSLTTNTTVQGNYIGVGADGTTALGNSGHGILVSDSSNNMIGGTIAGTGNIIANSGGHGVSLVSSAGTGTSILGNSIYGNTGLGIDLAGGTEDGFGVTANDTGDGDTGPNDLQNYPLLISANTDEIGNVYIAGSIQAAASTSYRVEFFANTAQDGSGHGEGETYLGFINVLTDATGNASFSTQFGAVVAEGSFLTTTATAPDGSTSEFSANVISLDMATLVVDTSSDAVDGNTASIASLLANRGADDRISLREAIMATNATPNGGTPDKIHFNLQLDDPNRFYYQNDGLPGQLTLEASTTQADGDIGDFDPDYPGIGYSWFRIQPTSALPVIGEAVIIDGYTQQGASPNTLGIGTDAVLKIVINGDLSGNADAFTITASSVELRGLVINGDFNTAIAMSGSNNTVSGMYIGTDATGMVAGANLDFGLVIDGGASSNTIGGVAAADRNVISGTTSYAIWLEDATTQGNEIRGNYIGTNAMGMAGLGNVSHAIVLTDGTHDNTIRDNVVSGNNVGIMIDGSISAPDSNTIIGNLIGTDATGTLAIANALGIFLQRGATNTTIGGTNASDRNIISGNFTDGIRIHDPGTSGNVVLGNFIGTDITGTVALANGQSGVEIGDSASGNTIGGTAAGARNIISGNTIGGVAIFTNASGNLVQGNYIGLDVTGTAGLGNGFQGVAITSGANNNTIGGTAAGAGNVISGNATDGVYISDAGTTANVVQGNYIGTDSSGTAAIGNGDDGIDIVNGATNNLIGGTVAGARNIVSGNTSDGISIVGATTTGNMVYGNYVGTDVTGTVALGNLDDGIDIQTGATGNLIGTAGGGNVISGNGAHGINISGDNNTVHANLIGTDASGSAGLGNSIDGIRIHSGAANNQIGGTGAGEGNVIADNNGNGIAISGPGTTGNVVRGNLVGTDAVGTGALGNATNGILIDNGATGNIIGGGSASERNVVSGNGWSGVSITGVGTNSNLVRGNYIGTDITGTAAIGNALAGVDIRGGAQNNVIGGVVAGQGNVISGNSNGVAFANAGTSGNRLEGNIIGLNATASAALANGIGIAIQTGAAGNTIGGTGAGAGNIISGNTGAGVFLTATAGSGNAILGNAIYANGGLGIDLQPSGVTANDPGDVDVGPNDLQNFPVLITATTDTVGNVWIDGSIDAAPGTSYRIEFFASATGDGSGHGEAEIYLGYVDVVTDGTGNATYFVNLPVVIPVGYEITATATDPAGNTSEFGANITTVMVNNAPVLTPATPALPTIDEDDIANGGILVSTLLGGSVTDPDSGAVEGIAITGLSSGNGTWQYSTDGGSNWIDVGAVSDASALLLRDSDLVRFVPDAQNADSASFTFRAWDQTSGSAGSYVNVTLNGGMTAFSSATDSASITVTAVNDAPVMAPAAPTLPTIDEDDIANGGILISTLLGGSVTDVDTGPLEGIAITGLSSGNGTWQYSTDGGSNWVDVGVVSDASALLLRDSDLVRFVPDAQNADAASFTFRAWDQTSGSAGSYVSVAVNGGITAFSAATDTASITVTAINDAPVLVPAAPTLPTIDEDDIANGGLLVSTLLGGSVTDVDNSASEGIAITGLSSGNGTWQYSTDGGSNWVDVGVVSDASALLLRDTDLVRFVPDGQNADAASFTFRAWDQTSGSAGSYVSVAVNGGITAFSAATDTASITVTAVNDAPVLAPATPTLPTIDEDDVANGGILVSTLLGGSVTDVDTGPLEGIAITGLASGNGTWQYSTDGGSNWVDVGAVSDASALLLRDSDLVRFVPDAQNADSASFTFRAWDQTAGSAGSYVSVAVNGGITAFSAATDTASITVTAVNDAPVLVPAVPTLPTINEDDIANGGILIATLLGGSVTDVDTGPLEGIAITGLSSGNGTWQYSTDGGSNWIDVGAVSDASALLLRDSDLVRFVPDGQNADAASFTFRAWDQTAGSAGSYVSVAVNGGITAFSAATDAASITVTAVNDAPVLVPATPTLPTIDEDDIANGGILIATLLGGSVTDVDTGPLEGIAITGLSSGNGTWQYSTDGGSNWIDVGAVSDASALLLRDSDLVRFVPDGQNADAASFTFRAWDQTSGSTGSYVSVAVNGGITAFSAATDTASITVTTVNDAPVLVPATPTLPTIDEDDIANGGILVSTLLGGSVTDVDTGPLEGIAITGLSSGNGTWQYSTDGGSNWIDVGAVSDASALLLRDSDLVRFVPDGQNADAASFTFRAWDQTSGAAGSYVSVAVNGGITAFSSASDTASITVTAVNDAPVLDNAGNMTLTNVTEDDVNPPGNTVASIIASAGGDRITDVDSGALEGIAITGVDDTNGTWQYSTDGGSNWTDFGAVSDSAAVLLDSTALIRFVPDASYTGPAGDITFRAWDLTSGANGQTGVNVSVNGGITAFSNATETATLNVNAVNDAPVLVPAAPALPTIDEDDIANGGIVVATLLGGSVTDIDAGALEGIAITSLSSGNGTWQYSTDGGSNWFDVGAVSDASALLLRDTDLVRFVPDAQNADAASFTFRAWDQTAGSTGSYVSVAVNGGITAFSSATDTASITVTAVNDAPVLTPAAPTLPTINENDIANGGILVSTLLGGSVADVDAGALEGIAITGLSSGNGTWQYSTDGGSNWFDVGAVSDASALLLSDTDLVRFVPDSLNADAASFTFRAWDQTSGSAGSYVNVSANGGITAFSGATDTASITVTTVNDTPATSGLSDVTVDEDAAPFIIDLNPAFSDADVADVLTLSIVGVSNPALLSDASIDAGGQLTLTPAADAFGQSQITIRATDSAGAFVDTTFMLDVNPVNDAPTTIGFTPLVVAEDAESTSFDLDSIFADIDDADLTFTIVSNDNPGLTVATVDAASGALNVDFGADANGASTLTLRATDASGASVDASLAVTVNAVDDASQHVVPAVQSINENELLLFGADSRITVSDIDGGPLSVTLSVINGTLSLGTIDGLSFEQGDGTADLRMTFTGSVDAINTALASLSFQPATDFDGVVQLQIASFSASVPPAERAPTTTDTLAIVVLDAFAPPTDDTPPAEVEIVATEDEVEAATVEDEKSADKPRAFERSKPTPTVAAVGAPLITPPVDAAPPAVEIPRPDAGGESTRSQLSALANLLAKSGVGNLPAFVINDVVWDALDSLKEQISDADEAARERTEMIVTVASGVTLSLSAGFVSWMMRAGSLVTSLLSTTPVWRGFDPLPVIAASRDDEEDEDDPDTIADLFGAG